MATLEYCFANKNPEIINLEWYGIEKTKPSWFKKLNPFTSEIKPEGYKKAYDSIKELKRIPFGRGAGSLVTFRSVKTCPGIGNYLDRTIPIKLPCDLALDTKEDGWRYFSNGDDLMDITSHPNNQIPIFKEYHILKICFPLYFKSKDKNLKAVGDFTLTLNDELILERITSLARG